MLRQQTQLSGKKSVIVDLNLRTSRGMGPKLWSQHGLSSGG